MSVTKDEIESFGRFATDRLERGGDTSLEELVTLWRRQQREGANAAIREGLQEADAGLGRPLDEFMSDFRAQNEISPDA